MKLALVFACSIAIIGLVLWSTTEQTVGPVSTPTIETSDGIASSTGETAPLIATPDVEQEIGRAEVSRESGGSGQSSAGRSAGKLFLQYVDKETGEPIPGLRFAAFTEQPKLTLLELGTTNQEGRAYVENVGTGLLLIETVREPPHAVNMTAVWVADNPNQSLTIRVSKGGSVAGRVINDLEQPVPDVAVFLTDRSRASSYWREKGYDPKPITWTDEDGEYEFAAVVSTAQGVWLKDGETIPETWQQVSLRVAVSNQSKRAQVDDGAMVRIPDFTVNRNQTYFGFVTDHENQLIAGALVSANSTRRHAMQYPGIATKTNRSAPGQAEFELLKNETLTDANGQFELELLRSPSSLHVWASGHTPESFSVEPLFPGQRSEEIELQLSNRRILEFELVDSEGERVSELKQFNDHGYYELLATHWLRSDAFRFSFDLGDGDWQHIETLPEADGLIRFSIDFTVDQIEKLLVHVKGYSVVDFFHASWSNASGPIKIEIQSLPTLKIQLNPPEIREGERLDSLVLHACTLSRSVRLDRRAENIFVCCGLGARFYPKTINDAQSGSAEDAFSRSFEIPVLESRAYEILVLRRQEESGPPAIFGPFFSDERLHQITLDRSYIYKPDEEPKNADDEKEAPAPSKPSDLDKVDNVFLRVVDAVTGELIPRVSLRVPSSDGLRGWYATTKQTKKASGGSIWVPNGEWFVQISGGDYQPADDVRVSVVGGSEVQLGTIELHPYPTLAVQFENSDNSELSEGGYAYVSYTNEAGKAKRRRAQLNSQGGFELKHAFPQELSIELSLPYQKQWAFQTWSLDEWNEGTIEVLTLARWTDVSIQLQVPVDYRHTSVWLKIDSLSPSAQPASRDDIENLFLRSSGTAALEDPAVSDGMRVFRSRLGPGRYVVHAYSELFKIEPVTFEVKADVEEMAIELTASW